MITIFKYEIPMKDLFTIDMYDGAEILTVQAQYGKPVMWAKVDTSKPQRKFKFSLCTTGHEAELVSTDRYIGSFQVDGGYFVGHIFLLGALNE